VPTGEELQRKVEEPGTFRTTHTYEISKTKEEYVMQPENMKSFAIAIITALGFLLANVPIACAQNTTQCTGTISDGSTINGNLVVPPNAVAH
jgi:hypothetical protein